MELATEAQRRRTFAIISHPDAGKTSLTETLLLYSGAIHLAGAVQDRKRGRATVSDWMKMEQERGISISSSVLQFDYEGSALNLLDTPGHADFSEDTYRTLAAVDSAVMLIDHAKGVEARTLKLFEVCRRRRMPVVTWVNKLDREGRHPLEILDEVSSALNLRVSPITWPIGMGRRFQGVVDTRTRVVTLYERVERRGAGVPPSHSLPLDEAEERLGSRVFDELNEDLELLEGAGDPYTHADFISGDTSPTFFGSAITGFGVEPFLSFMASSAAPPGPRTAKTGVVDPQHEAFSGFVFKIQANMNPKHRDRIAFVRVVSGRFRRGMDTIVGRNGATLKLRKPHSFMAAERSIVDEAWPGDIVGLHDPGNLRIGDTLAEGERVEYQGIPRFAPEFFVRVRLNDPLKRKQLNRGLEQLSQEGVIQLFRRADLGLMDPYLGAVGMLQFEVLKERLASEYNVHVEFETLPYKVARWVRGSDEDIAWLQGRREHQLVRDRHGSPVTLATTQWLMDYVKRDRPGIELWEVEPL